MLFFKLITCGLDFVMVFMENHKYNKTLGSIIYYLLIILLFKITLIISRKKISSIQNMIFKDFLTVKTKNELLFFLMSIL